MLDSKTIQFEQKLATQLFLLVLLLPCWRRVGERFFKLQKFPSQAYCTNYDI